MLDFTNGSGFVSLDWALTLFIVLATFMTAAVLRAPDVVEPTMQQISRRIMLGGLLIMSARYVYVMATVGDILISPVSAIGISFLCLGLVLKCVCLLFPQINEVDLYETERTIEQYHQEIDRMTHYLDKTRRHNRNKNPEERQEQ